MILKFFSSQNLSHIFSIFFLINVEEEKITKYQTL